MWLTDRSRYTTGLNHCQMARYLNYHAGEYGYGWSLRGNSVPLSTGIYVHEALAGLMGLAKTGTYEGEKSYRHKIDTAVQKYRAAVKAAPLTEQDASDHTAEEQAHLLEALAWGFVRLMLPILKERFKIIDIEREEQLVLGDMTQMSKPDMLVEDKKTGLLALVDFKTASDFGDSWVEGFREDIQAMVGVRAVEERVGRPVESYWICGLRKGGRRKFAARGEETAEKRQYSHLCYVTAMEPNPPMRTELTLQTTGLWVHKQPVWKLKLPTAKGQSNAEWWAKNIEQIVLAQDYTLVGPYSVDRYMVSQYFSAMANEEGRWIQLLWDIYEAELKAGWASRPFQAFLDKTIARSYACFSYFGERCPYYRLCFKREGWQDPSGSGHYKHRRPHHLPEIEQMKQRGIPVPAEPWEEG